MADTKRASRFWIAAPFALAALLVAGWTGYWFFAKGQLERGIDAWIAQERARGAVVEFSEKRLSGYPFRFVLDVTAPVYGQAAPGPRWQGDALQLIMQPWNYSHVMARAPGRNTLFLSPETTDTVQLVLGRKSAASLSWRGAQFTRFSLVLDEASLLAAGAPVGETESLELHLRQVPSDLDMLQLETHWQAVRLAEPLPGDGALLGQSIGPSILRAELDEGMTALATLSDPSDLIAEALRLGGALNVPQILVEWGPASLGARASLSAPGGEVRGTAGIRIDRAEALRGAIAGTNLDTEEAQQALTALEAASQDGGFFSVSLRGDGIYFLGRKQVDLPIGAYL
ncbi:MAG: DUF2125 domain-containing protein [Pseudomonadota bacterium]